MQSEQQVQRPVAAEARARLARVPGGPCSTEPPWTPPFPVHSVKNWKHKGMRRTLPRYPLNLLSLLFFFFKYLVTSHR